MITDARCEKALNYLAATDAKGAMLKVQVARKEYQAKLARARVFLTSDGSVEAKKAIAESSPEAAKAEDELCDAIIAFETVKARRMTAGLIVETWRSVNANRRHGNI